MSCCLITESPRAFKPLALSTFIPARRIAFIEALPPATPPNNPAPNPTPTFAHAGASSGTIPCAPCAAALNPPTKPTSAPILAGTLAPFVANIGSVSILVALSAP